MVLWAFVGLRLVLVNTEFNRLSDSLFVILNSNNEIIGVDFPSDPIAPVPPVHSRGAVRRWPAAW